MNFEWKLDFDLSPSSFSENISLRMKTQGKEQKITTEILVDYGGNICGFV